MNCQEFQQVMLESLGDPQASPPALQAHLGTCADCREAQAEFAGLHARLREVPLPDPGEFFFQRQLRQIEATLSTERESKPFWHRLWIPSLAAAAILLVFFGYSTFFKNPGADWRGNWPSALSWLAQEGPEESGWLELEELNEEQLAAYARTVELQVLGAEDDADIEDGTDLQDLDGQEMDLLIERLQAGMGGKTS